MQTALAEKPTVTPPRLRKTDPRRRAFGPGPDGGLVTVQQVIAEFDVGGWTFVEGEAVALPATLEIGDYGLFVEDDKLVARVVASLSDLDGAIGGFHFAPGGNAPARDGGDAVPAINPCSIWDLGFRPASADPRGMALVEGVPGSHLVPAFWSDIYLTAQHHLEGTSRCGATIADGRNLPQKLTGSGNFPKCDFETAKAVLAHHGKRLPSTIEFAALAYGVREKSASGKRQEQAGLEAPYTSRSGVMMATAQRWCWGHDGDPDMPRASHFGGSHWSVDDAGSRYALVDVWAGLSDGDIGLRGCSDHLAPA